MKKKTRVAPQGGARGEDLAAEDLKTADSPLPLPPALAAVAAPLASKAHLWEACCGGSAGAAGAVSAEMHACSGQGNVPWPCGGGHLFHGRWRLWLLFWLWLVAVGRRSDPRPDPSPVWFWPADTA